MTSTSLDPTTRRVAPGATAPIAASVAAAAFAVEGVLALVHPTGDDHWDGLSLALDAAYLIGCLALVVALPALARWLRTGRAGTVGVLAARLGFAAMAVESAVSAAEDRNTLGLLFSAGLLLSVVGLLVLAIAGLVAGARRWAAALPFLGLLVGIAGGDHGGSLVLGVVWALLAAAFVRDRP